MSSSSSSKIEKMDTDGEPSTSTGNISVNTGCNVMAAAGTVASVTVSLHPLVVMNISEHWTRIRAQAGFQQQVFGAIIGKQKGRAIEIMNSFELKVDLVEGEVIINRDYYKTKESQYKQVFSDLDFLGWYTTGDELSIKDINIHKQICEINECPIMLQLDPLCHGVDQLQIKLFESVIDIIQGEATMLFVPLVYTLATEEAERIGVDHVARMSSSESGEKSVVAEHLIAQHSAIKMLHSRIKMVLLYIKAIENGDLPVNHSILRDIYALSRRLPVVQGSVFNEEFYTQSNDVGLITYLGALTKGCNDVNHFVNKFNVLYDRQSMGRRMRGLLF